MKKKIAAALLVMIFAVFTAGCGNRQESIPGTKDADTKQTEQEGTTADSQKSEPDSVTEIIDENGGHLGAIDSRAFCTAADAGVFYSIFEPSEYALTAPAEYHFFRREDGKDVLLGTLEEQGYEAVFVRTELDGIFYTLAIVGNPMDYNPDKLVLLACDPAAETMKTYTISESGFPYAAMAAVNGKLLIMNHEMSEPKCDKVYAFDPASEKISEVLQVPDDGNSLRGICGTEEGFCLLRLQLDGGSVADVFLDQYDQEYRKKSELSVTDEMIRAIQSIGGIMGRQDALNELGMMASRFAVLDGRFLLYENFGLSRIIVDLTDGGTIFSRDDNYEASLGSGEPVFYRMDFDPENIEDPEILGILGGEIREYDFRPAGSCKLIQSVSRSSSGTYLVLLADSIPARTGTTMLQLWTEP